MAKGKKPTKAERQKRLFIVYRLLLSARDRVYIIQYCAEKWGVEERAVDNYIHEAKKWIYAQFEEKKDQLIKESIALRLDLLAEAKRDGEKAIAHEIVKDLDRLRALYPIEKSKHEIDLKTGLADILALAGQEIPKGKENKLRKDG